MGKLSHFRQLEAWKEAHRLVSQMRRAAVSVPANIAEGFKRRGIRDKIRFYNISEASLEEVKYYCLLSEDLEYIAPDSHAGLTRDLERNSLPTCTFPKASTELDLPSFEHFREPCSPAHSKFELSGR